MTGKVKVEMSEFLYLETVLCTNGATESEIMESTARRTAIGIKKALWGKGV